MLGVLLLYLFIIFYPREKISRLKLVFLELSGLLLQKVSLQARY